MLESWKADWKGAKALLTGGERTTFQESWKVEAENALRPGLSRFGKWNIGSGGLSKPPSTPALPLDLTSP